MKRIKIGDVFEIQTAKGLVYGQFTHKNQKYGALIRIFSEFFDTRPQDLIMVCSQTVQFMSFFPIQSAVNAGLIVLVGNQVILEKNLIFPIFRAANFGKDAKRDADDWWLWDGETSTRLGRNLTDEEKKYPTEGIISFPLLVERAEKQYRAEIDDIY